MKVIHISTSDISGGAAKATYKLHHELLRQGIYSRMLVRYKLSKDETVIQYQPATSILSRLIRKLKRLILQRKFSAFQFNKQFDVFSTDQSEFSKGFNEYVKGFDIINLHWISGFIDFGSFFRRYQDSFKIVWRFADMNPFTGGCHHSWGCKKFASGCGNCPQSGSAFPEDLSAKVMARKKSVLQKVPRNNLHIIILSEWMYKFVTNGSIFYNYQVSLIPNGVELDIFNPRDKIEAKRTLGIPSTKRVLFLLADNLNLVMKGSQFGIDAVNMLSDSYFLLLAGSHNVEIPIQIPHHYFGQISDKKMLSVLFNAADAFLYTSLQENFPNTALEAIACGTPILGFPTGGVLDIAKEWEHAIYSHELSARALADTIELAFGTPGKLSEMSVSCAEWAIKKFNVSVQAQNYIALYNSLLDNKE